jgi:hypothetical protein
MNTDPPVTGIPEDPPEHPGAASSSAAGPTALDAPDSRAGRSPAGQSATEPLTATLDRLREAASSHDPDGPAPH